MIELSNGISRENITSPFISVRVTHESLMATFAKVPLIEFTLRHSIFGFIKTLFVPPTQKNLTAESGEVCKM